MWVDGLVLDDYLKTKRDFKELRELYAQLFLLFSYLNKARGIVHGDSLPHNILLKTIPKGGSIKYSLLGKEYYFNNYGYIPVIWDFGISRTTKGKGYYRIGEIISNESASENIIDIYKLCDSLKYKCYSENSSFFNYMRTVYFDYIENGIFSVLKPYTEFKNDYIVDIR